MLAGKTMLKERIGSLLLRSAWWGIALCGMLVYSCARLGSAPAGGPVDLAPPMLLKAIPQEGSTRFQAKEITLDFDEYIVLQNTDKIVTSPRISKISYRGNLKRVQILIDDTLQEDRTYSIDFKDAIGDLHEARPIKDYVYYFSTGSKLDSGRITGQVLDAFSLSPVKEASVMLYSRLPSGYPVDTAPDYVAVTDSAGIFSFRFIKEGCYHVLAGSDENRNYLVEPTEEKTAFSSSCWSTTSVKPPVYHQKRRGMKESDTAAYQAYLAAIRARKEEDLDEIKASERILYLYQDKYEKNLLKEAKWVKKGEIALTWHYKPDTLAFAFLPSYQDYELAKQLQSADTASGQTGRAHRRRAEKQEMPNLFWQDSLVFYYVPQDDPLAGKIYFDNYRVSDLRLVVSHSEFSDTVELMLGTGLAAKEDTAAFRLSARQSSIFFKDSLVLDFTFPLSAYDFQHAALTRYHTDEEGRTDTVREDVSGISVIRPRPDRLVLKSDWKAGDRYGLFLPSACFVDYLGRHADTSEVRFQCPGLDTYGQVVVTLRGLRPGNHELQMVDNGKNVIQSLPVPENGKVEFEYVKPGYVSFVLVEDLNGNRRWDAGDYVQGRQPERRWFFPKTIRAEADWRVEETWSIE